MKKGVRIVLIVAIVLAPAGGAWWYFGSGTWTGAEAGSIADGAEDSVVAVEATEGSVRVVVEGPGSVSPVRTQTIRSGISGVVTNATELGDRVTQGQIVVAFDAEELTKAIRHAELSLRQAQLNREKSTRELANAQETLRTTQRLERSGAATREQAAQAATAVDNAEFALRAADLTVEQAELALESAREDLEMASVRAPFSGVVLESSVGAGDRVSANAVLVVLADLSQVRIEAQIDEYDIGKVETGQRVTVTGDALGDYSRSSRVERISPAAVVVNNIPIFTVSAIVDNSDGKLRPGMNTDLEIMISADRGVVVPSKAVSTVRDRSYADVVADGVVETRRITIGADDGRNVAVIEGLQAGDRVVLPQATALSLTSGAAPAAGTSVIPINVPGTGGSR